MIVIVMYMVACLDERAAGAAQVVPKLSCCLAHDRNAQVEETVELSAPGFGAAGRISSHDAVVWADRGQGLDTEATQ